MIYGSTVFVHAIGYMRQILSRERVLEIVALCVALGVVGLLATSITPYKPDNQQAVTFYADESRTNSRDSTLRARVDKKTDSNLTVTLQDGPRAGSQQVITGLHDDVMKNMRIGETILVLEQTDNSNILFYDSLRIPGLLMLIMLFVGVVILIGRRKGFMSIIGLGVSMILIGWYIVPLLLAGHSALLVCISGAYMIALFSIYIAHGVNKRTTIAVCCIGLILAIVIGIATATVYGLSLAGLNDETAYYLSFERTNIDMRGILVGGIVIATLGVLDDIVTAQVAVVDELHTANPKLSARSLYSRASSVGGEHIASLVNTLALAYAGASLPMVLVLAQQEGQSTFLLFNSEFIATEVARTLVASLGLVLAVPISTLTAVVVYKRLLK